MYRPLSLKLTLPASEAMLVTVYPAIWGHEFLNEKFVIQKQPFAFGDEKLGIIIATNPQHVAAVARFQNVKKTE